MAEQLSNQTTGGGSNPTPPLQFSRCTLKDVSQFVKTYHYSRSHPGGVDFSFGVYQDQTLVGAALFGHIAGNPMAACVLRTYNDPKKYRELMRLVLLDEVPKMTESKFVGWCIRELKKKTDLLALISFADPKFGHVGTVYQAGNWIYTGLQKPDRDRIFIDGVERHPKSIYNLYGTSSLPRIRELLPTSQITTAPREPKHRYVFVLRPELRSFLKFSAKPYPKALQFGDSLV